MSALSSANLDQLREEFYLHDHAGGYLSQEEFVAALMKHCPFLLASASESFAASSFASSCGVGRPVTPSSSPESGSLSCITYADAVSSISGLFRDVDCDDDGRVSWDELYTFAIDSAMQRMARRPVENILSYSCSKNVPRDDNVQSLFYLDGLDCVLASSRRHTFQLLNPSTYQPQFQFKSCDTPFDVFPVCATFLAAPSLVCTFCTDMAFRIWTVVEQSLIAFKPSPVGFYITQLRCQRAPSDPREPQLLYSTDRLGRVTGYEILRTGEPRVRDVWHVQPEEDAIADLCFVPPSETKFVTSAFDHSLRLTDISSKKTEITESTQSTLVMLKYSDATQYLCAVGIDNSLSAWVLHKSSKPCTPLVDPSRPHNGKILSLDVPAGTPQVVTTDTEGTIKVWDLRMFRCAQTLAVGTTLENLGMPTDDVHGGQHVNMAARSTTTACYVPTRREITCAAASRLVVHEYAKGVNPELADELHTVAVTYNPNANQIVTASSRDVQVWDAQRGVLLASHKAAAPTDITAMCIDGNGRRVFLGTHDGLVVIRALHSGTLTTQVKLHFNEITGIMFSSHHKLLVTAGLDGVCCVYSEAEGPSTMVRVSHGSIPLTALDISPALGLIATGNARGRLFLSDFTHPRVIVAEVDGPARVRAVCFLDQFPAIAVAYHGGRVILWTCRPVLETLQLMEIDLRPHVPVVPWSQNALSSSDEKSAIHMAQSMALDDLAATAMDFDPFSHTLWIGDTTGGVTAWRLCGLLQLCHLSRCSYPATPMFALSPPPNIKKEGSAAFMFYIKAHAEEVLSVRTIPSFSVVITSGDDRRVALWNESGEKVGELSSGRADETADLAEPVHAEGEKEGKMKKRCRRFTARILHTIEAFSLISAKAGRASSNSCTHKIRGRHKAKDFLAAPGMLGSQPASAQITPQSSNPLEPPIDVNQLPAFNDHVQPATESCTNDDDSSYSQQHAEEPSEGDSGSGEASRREERAIQDLNLTMRTLALRRKPKTRLRPDRSRSSTTQHNVHVEALLALSEKRANAEAAKAERIVHDEPPSIPKEPSMDFDTLPLMPVLPPQPLPSKPFKPDEKLTTAQVVAISLERLRKVNNRTSFIPRKNRVGIARVVETDGQLVLSSSWTPRLSSAGIPRPPPTARCAPNSARPRASDASGLSPSSTVRHGPARLVSTVPRPPRPRGPDLKEAKIVEYSRQLKMCLGWHYGADVGEQLHDTNINLRNWTTKALRGEMLYDAVESIRENTEMQEEEKPWQPKRVRHDRSAKK